MLTSGLFVLVLLLAVSGQASASNYLVTVTPDTLTVNNHVGGVDEPNLVLTFTVPVAQNLVGGGLPDDLYKGTGEDRSIIQIELPISKRNSLSGEEGTPRVSETGASILLYVRAFFASPPWEHHRARGCALVEPHLDYLVESMIRVSAQKYRDLVSFFP